MKQSELDEIKESIASLITSKEEHQENLNELKSIEEARFKELEKSYNMALKELEDYKGARLKYKRRASAYEYKYNKITQSKIYIAYKNIAQVFNPLFTISNKVIAKIYKKDTILGDPNFRKEIFEAPKLHNIAFDNSLTPTTIIYADLNMNIVDGSSIWLSSVTNLFNLLGDVVIVSKYDINSDLITSNFKDTDYKRIIIEPKDLNIDRALTTSEVSTLLIHIDEILPRVQNLLVRGTEIIEEIIKTNNFKGRLIPYLTNFYTQKKYGPVINQNVISTLEMVSLQAKVWLWQTDEMRSFVEKNTTLNNNDYILFPPILETQSFVDKKRKRETPKESKETIIGYAGKIQPDWGVLELIKETEKLVQNGHKIKLRIISSKISWRGTIKSGEGFVEEVKKYLKKDFVEYIKNVNRDEAIDLLSDVDFIWCYRDEVFENSTLELSTKLLEAVSLGKPLISYPSLIHKQVLGNDYPYYLKDPSDLIQVLSNKNDFNLDALASKIIDDFSAENRINKIKSLINPAKNIKLLIAGHDYKFIDHYYSNLKNEGYQVFKDYWEWGKADLIKRSEYLYKKSDVIFCEWGLENAVWYSKNNHFKKPLYIREHLQEINSKARRFGPNIDIDKVTKVIFVSKRVCEIAIEMWSWPNNKTMVIPNYVLTDDFIVSKKTNKPQLNFGMVGITPQRKRLDRAITLMEEILKTHPEAKLYIKGERPENYPWMHAPGRVEELDYYKKEYERIEENKLLKNAIIFDGFGNDMPNWYQKIDFILSPSDFESFHYALADGVSSGCVPIVWNWEESEKIYTKKWVVNSESEALNIVENTLSLRPSEFKKLIQKNKDLIVKKYGYKKIYHSLIDTTLN